MTIARRIALSFLIVLLLFALNLAVFFVGDIRRRASVEELRKAVDHQILLGAIVQDLDTLQRQVALLSQIANEQQVTSPAPEDKAQFDFRIESISVRVKLLRETAPDDPAIAKFARMFDELGRAWRTFYANFGVDQAKAITVLATVADPLSQQLKENVIPQLDESEKRRVQQASDRFYSTAALANRIAIAIFIVTALLAIAVAWYESRRLNKALNQLRV
jgi:CHASE3 domain sensor protein